MIVELIEAGLVDEMLMLVNPIFLGKGKRLFAEGTQARAFELVSQRASPTGVQINKFKYLGTLRIAF